jgi:PAS domain S-box-containing protein
MLSGDSEVDERTPDKQLRVLLLVARRRDRELFADRLGDRYTVGTAEPRDEWPEFDICLIDSTWFRSAADELHERRAVADPVQLPVLLLLRGQPADNPWLGDALGGVVDDVVELPANGMELDARVDSLARTRRMSTTLAAQRDRLRLFRRAIEEAAVGVTITDYTQPDNPLIYGNDRFEEVTGYGPEEYVGRNCRFLQGPDTDQEPVAELRRAIDAGESTRVQLWNYRKDGTPFWSRVTVAPVWDEAGTITHYVGFQEDVTEEFEQERRYEAILDNADQFAGLLAPDGTLIEVNASALAAIDADRADVVGRPFPETEWFDDDSRSLAEDVIDRAADGELVRGELDLTLGGYDMTLAFTLNPVTDAEGAVELIVVEGRDVTPRKERERELREEYGVTEAILDAAPDILYMFDTDGNYVRWNERFEAVCRPLEDDISELHPFDFIPEDERERVHETLSNVTEGGAATVRTEIRTSDGERTPYEFSHARVQVDGETAGYAGIGRDISAQVERERELERFEAILQAAPDPVYALDAAGRFTIINDTLVEILGREREELIGAHVSTIMPDQDVAEGQSLIEGLRTSDAAYETLETNITTGNGDTRLFEVNITLLTDEADDLLGTVGVCRDVTELRQSERRISVFDRVLRHNLRNKMNIILARAANVEGGDADSEAEAAAIRQAAEELLALSDRAREFHPSIDPDSDPERVELADLVRRVANEHREQFPDCTITVSAPGAAWVRGHETLELALDELVGNAIAHNDRDHPTVELRVTTDDDRVSVEVADDGPGIGELERNALERGHETPLEHATGLGLWFVRWTVTNAGGDISFRENEPRGSVVRLSLPRADPPS